MKQKTYLQIILLITILALSFTGCKEEIIPEVPTVITFPVSDIDHQSATCGGSINSESLLTVRGICWSTTQQTPTINDTISTEGNETGSFSSYLQNLIPDTTYYVRAYATNSVGTGYGSTMKFRTKKASIQVVTLPITEISLTSATGAAQISSDKGVVVTERGLCWSTLPYPTINNSNVLAGQGEGSFTAILTELTANTIYYLRAYAKAGDLTIYGSVIIFKTRQIALNVTTLPVTEITQTTAKCGGIVSCDIPTSVTAYGVCWSTTDNPTIADSKTPVGIGDGSFSSYITSLTGNTTYYFRAYATNIEGTTYGSTMTFKTSPTVPTMSTLAVNNIVVGSAKCDIKILSNGGAPITTYGVCYGTTPNPSLSNYNSYTSSFTITDNSTHTITALIAYTKYYVRAYATNSVGTAYGNDLEFVAKGTEANNGIIFNSNLSYGTVSDNEGNSYKTITIGTQTWMAENLRATKFRNGDVIPQTSSDSQDLTIEETPIYQWEVLNPLVYGRLYTWFAATDSRNICPEGWHIPTDAEWNTLTDYIGGISGSADKMREVGTTHWTGTNNATNSSGFTALPSGYIQATTFETFVSGSGVWWSSTSPKVESATCRNIYGSFANVQKPNYSKKFGVAIRCVKD
jgi:uncharacterized protein (TIGR02145 family)